MSMRFAIPPIVRPTLYFGGFRELFDLTRRHGNLIRELSRREVLEQYKGQVFGAIWAVIHPLSFAAIFIFIFGIIFNARIGGTVEMPFDYPAYIMAGIFPWVAFQEVMSKSCSLILANTSLVKQVMFRTEILPIKTSVASLIPQIIGMITLFLYVIIKYQFVFYTWLLIPVLLLIQFMAMLCVSYLFSAVGVFFRDLKDFVRLYSILGIYITPIVFLPDWVPSGLKFILYLNPYSYVVWCYQDALYFGEIRHPEAWIVTLVMIIIGIPLSLRAFKTLSSNFGDQV